MPDSTTSRGTRVVVTGGAGFIGGALCRQLLSAAHEVVLYDSLAAGPAAEERAAVLSAAGAKMVHGDIRDAGALRAVLRPNDTVVHLAAIASVPVCIENPGLCRAVNLEGALTVLAEAQAAGVRQIVFSSTAAIYGPNPNLPSDEEDDPAPASPYAVAKLAVEAAMQASGMNVVNLRLFNVYGPGQDPQSSYSGVISRWLTALQRREAVTLFGDGRQTRDFVHVDDVAMAVRAAFGIASRPPGPINIGSGEPTTLLELLSVLSAVLDVRPVLRYAAPRAGDVPHSCANVERARRLLCFTPSVELRQGLQFLAGRVQ